MIIITITVTCPILLATRLFFSSWTINTSVLVSYGLVCVLAEHRFASVFDEQNV